MNDEKENLPEEESNDPQSSESQSSESESSEPESTEPSDESTETVSSIPTEPEQVSAPPPPPPSASEPAGEPTLASPGDRFLAALIDGILTVAVYIIPILGWIVGFAYSLTKDALPFLDGQSIGKKAMKIRVVKEDTNEPITNDYGAAVLRAISLMIPIFGIVDALMVLSSDRKRFGDKWAKTKVIKEKA
jgi:uncharacterized RDD family membrane protein YckC